MKQADLATDGVGGFFYTRYHIRRASETETRGLRCVLVKDKLKFLIGKKDFDWILFCFTLTQWGFLISALNAGKTNS